MNIHINVSDLASRTGHQSAIQRELVNQTPDYELGTFNHSFVESNQLQDQHLSEIILDRTRSDFLVTEGDEITFQPLRMKEPKKSIVTPLDLSGIIRERELKQKGKPCYSISPLKPYLRASYAQQIQQKISKPTKPKQANQSMIDNSQLSKHSRKASTYVKPAVPGFTKSVSAVSAKKSNNFIVTKNVNVVDKRV